MRISTSQVRSGLHAGQTVWVCHYYRPDMQKKPLRKVPPTKCMIKSIDELPKNKTVYYSQNYFAPINGKGVVTSKVISPVDNTGFRSRCGNELFVFYTERECVAEWNAQVTAHSEVIEGLILSAADRWKQEKSDLLSLRMDEP